MIELVGAEVELPGFTLGPLDVRVTRGEHLVILGPSGAGKSLLLELVAGFRELKRGKLTLRDADAAIMPARERNLAWVPQSLGLFPHLDARENIAFPLRARGEVDLAPIAAMAERLRITHLLERDVQGLSGGERQRVALARAFVASRDIMLLDEPFAALDRTQRREGWELLAGLARERTVLHVTHDREEASFFAARTVWLDAGRFGVAAPDDR